MENGGMGVSQYQAAATHLTTAVYLHPHNIFQQLKDFYHHLISHKNKKK
jgi:hypothetical protein